MNRTNEQIFNRPPRRHAVDVNVDSANRDKLRFPESNNYVIQVPGGPYKMVRSVDVLQMRVPHSESLVQHMQHPAMINTSTQQHNYDHGSDTFCLREGYVIDRHNDQFRFSCGTRVFSLQLPHTLTPVQSYRVEDGLLIVRCSRASRLIPNSYVALIACESEVAGEYVVHGLRDNHTIELEPTDCRQLPNLCGNCGFLYLPPPSTALELCSYISTLLLAVCEVHVRIEFQVNGWFIIHKPDGTQDKRRCLIGDDKDVIRARLPNGPHSLSEIGGLLQRVLNPPLIIKDENDRLVFSDRWRPPQEIILDPGYYGPEVLIQRICQLMSDKSEQSRFVGSYDKGKFTIASEHGLPFSLHFNKCPAIGFTLGFQPACLSDSDVYESRSNLCYRQSECGHAANLYNVALDPARTQFTFFRNGVISADCTVQPDAANSNFSIVKCKGPHAFHCDDVVLLHSEVGGLAVVTEVIDWQTFRIACPLLDTLECQISAAPKPFTLPTYLPEANIAAVLGFERIDHADPQYCYTSDCRCLTPANQYLLLRVPEILAASEASTKPIYHVTGLGEPYGRYLGRLDRYLSSNTFEFSHYGPAQEDLFVGNTVVIDCITVQIYKPDGTFYDTGRCDHSFVLRIVMED